VTLPSFGLILADHVSLGRGAMLQESTLLAIDSRALPADLSAAAIDMALGLAAAAVLALALSVPTSVRQRRRQLAVLKTLGLRQLRAIVAWQASMILVIAAVVGVPLGVAAAAGPGRASAARWVRPSRRGSDARTVPRLRCSAGCREPTDCGTGHDGCPDAPRRRPAGGAASRLAHCRHRAVFG
jgi:hypothetical protein